jgi:predicted MFS family arabinose efflux permease
MMSEATIDEELAPTRHAGGAASRMTAGEWLLLLILATVQFTHIVDFMIIMPLGPVYIREMGMTTREFGSVVAAYTIAAGLAGILAARFLDRFDRKSALLVLYSGFTAGTLLCAAAPNYPLLLAARTVAGAFGGVAAAVVLAIVGDAFPDTRRATAMGVIMSAFSVASILGMPLGLYCADLFGWHATFLVLGGQSGLVLLLAAAMLPPLRGHLGRRPTHTSVAWAILTDRNHVRAYALTVTLVFTSFMVAPYLATFLVANVGLEQGQLKYMYLCGGLATLATLTPLGRLADRCGKLPVYRALALATMATIVLLTNLSAGAGVVTVLALTTTFMVMSAGRMVPAMALITASAAPRDRGGFMSLNAAVQHLSSGAATAIAGGLLGELPDGALDGFPLIGWLAGLATLFSLILAGRLRPALGGDLAPDSLAVVAEVS